MTRPIDFTPDRNKEGDQSLPQGLEKFVANFNGKQVTDQVSSNKSNDSANVSKDNVQISDEQKAARDLAELQKKLSPEDREHLNALRESHGKITAMLDSLQRTGYQSEHFDKLKDSLNVLGPVAELLNGSKNSASSTMDVLRKAING